jgi:hypothetical protein
MQPSPHASPCNGVECHVLNVTITGEDTTRDFSPIGCVYPHRGTWSGQDNRRLSNCMDIKLQ